MKFFRSSPRRDREPRLAPAGGGGSALRTDEVSRHAVRLVVIDGDVPRLVPFSQLPSLLRAGDLVVVNDAATLPASLPGETGDGAVFELRLSGPIDGSRLSGVLLGAGDHRTRTEHRPPPPMLAVGELVRIASFSATVVAVAGRRVELMVPLAARPGSAGPRSTAERCEGIDELWRAIYAAGAPVQYAHRPEQLPLYAVQTAYAARPWAAEMPSAGRPLTWDVLLGLRRAGVEIATLTHAAGLSSTGDEGLDQALPWPERYEVPAKTVAAINLRTALRGAARPGEPGLAISAAKARGGRVIAVGTTVVRALEAAAQADGELRAGSGVATLRLDPGYVPKIVDGLISGLHVPGESHFELLQAFAPRDRLERGLVLAAVHGLSSHELGDACVILRS